MASFISFETKKRCSRLGRTYIYRFICISTSSASCQLYLH